MAASAKYPPLPFAPNTTLVYPPPPTRWNNTAWYVWHFADFAGGAAAATACWMRDKELPTLYKVMAYAFAAKLCASGAAGIWGRVRSLPRVARVDNSQQNSLITMQAARILYQPPVCDHQPIRASLTKINAALDMLTAQISAPASALNTEAFTDSDDITEQLNHLFHSLTAITSAFATQSEEIIAKTTQLATVKEQLTALTNDLDTKTKDLATAQSALDTLKSAEKAQADQCTTLSQQRATLQDALQAKTEEIAAMQASIEQLKANAASINATLEQERTDFRQQSIRAQAALDCTQETWRIAFDAKDGQTRLHINMVQRALLYIFDSMLREPGDPPSLTTSSETWAPLLQFLAEKVEAAQAGKYTMNLMNDSGSSSAAPSPTRRSAAMTLNGLSGLLSDDDEDDNSGDVA